MNAARDAGYVAWPEPLIMRRLAALVLPLCALVLGGLVLAAPASAHASVVSSNPLDGARLSSAPSLVTITFNEPVGLGLGYLHVTDRTGRRVERGVPFHPGGDGAKVAVPLASGLGDGTYTESFRVISADSHPTSGVIRFVVGNGALEVTTEAGSTVNRVTSVVFDVVRWLSFAGIALLFGAWLLLTVWPQGRDDVRARRIVWTGWGAAAAGAAAELLLQGPYAAGSGLSALTTGSLLDDTLHTTYGGLHAARLLLLGVLALVLARVLETPERRGSRWEDAAWPLGVALALTFAAAGHARTTYPRWFAVTADVLHVTAMATWLGALALLVGAVLPRREPDEQRRVLPAVSRVAFAAVTTLVVTGAYAAWRGVGTVDAVFTTTYGRLVAVKVALACGLLALGYVARRAVQRHVGERVRRAVLVELVLAAGVLVATSVLVAQPRGQEALALRDLEPVTGAAALGGGRTATVTLDPGRHGTVTVAVTLGNGPVPQQVSATASLPSAELGPIPVPLRVQGRNRYSAAGVDLPKAGRWVIHLVITTSEFSATTADVTVRLH